MFHSRNNRPKVTLRRPNAAHPNSSEPLPHFKSAADEPTAASNTNLPEPELYNQPAPEADSVARQATSPRPSLPLRA